MNRAEILEAANKCVSGERERSYGSPENNFSTIADLWNAYLHINHVITSKDVAAMLALLKIARISSGNYKEDNWIDLAGYAACGGEIEHCANGLFTGDMSCYSDHACECSGSCDRVERKKKAE